MGEPKVQKPTEGSTTCKKDLYDAPIPSSKEAHDENMANAAQANLDRFGLNVDALEKVYPQPNGRET